MRDDGVYPLHGGHLERYIMRAGKVEREYVRLEFVQVVRVLRVERIVNESVHGLLSIMYEG